MTIYVLRFWDIEKEEKMTNFYFTSLENAGRFIVNNFQWDEPKKITSSHYQGNNNIYVINSSCIDPERIWQTRCD